MQQPLLLASLVAALTGSISTPNAEASRSEARGTLSDSGTVSSTDITLLSGALNRAVILDDHLSLGGTLGLGPPFYIVFRKPHEGAPFELDEFLPIEVLSAGVFAGARFQRLDIDAGARVSYAKYSDTCNESFCESDPEWGVQLGPYIDVRGGWERLKLGPRIELAFDVTRDETLVLISPLTARWTF